MSRPLTLAAAAAASLVLAPTAWADDADQAKPPSPAVTVKIKNTLDLWRNTEGGLSVGDTTLDKLQVSVTLDGDAIGLPGFKAHTHVFKTNGESLSGSRTGDIQTASNIEALSVTRLFELWAEQQVGKAGQGGVAVRAGLMDLNETFDSIDVASVFLNSSHGIAPDLSRSGRAGPSIFPVTAAGIQVAWTPSDRLTINAAAFDGTPGDPRHPKAFVAVRLDQQAGALLITQADYKLGGDTQVSVGMWDYTSDFSTFADPDRRRLSHPGLYGFVEAPAPLPGKAKAWLRAGIADGRVQAVSAYVGTGVVWTGVLPGRDDDQAGLALAHAAIGRDARHVLGLPRAETTWEATYSYKLNGAIHLQPDVQYIVHPSLAPRLPNALAVGLRIVAEFKQPSWSPEDDN